MTRDISPPRSAVTEDPHWLSNRLSEARAVIADVAHHSDHLIRLACQVLACHGESDAECREAQVLLLIVDARTPQRQGRHQRPDADDDPEVAS